jgi:hypothetical protein
MIKHTVMFRFKSDVPDEKRQSLLDEYLSLPSVYPKMKNYAFGKNISERDQTFEYAFSVEFETEEELKEYLNSEIHEKHVIERWRPMIESRAIASFVDATGSGKSFQAHTT